MNDSQFKQILNRLDALARLSALNLPEKISQPDKIRILANMDIQPKDIATILGITPNAVRIALHRIKKRKKSSKKSEKKDE